MMRDERMQGVIGSRVGTWGLTFGIAPSPRHAGYFVQRVLSGCRPPPTVVLSLSKNLSPPRSNMKNDVVWSTERSEAAPAAAAYLIAAHDAAAAGDASQAQHDPLNSRNILTWVPQARLPLAPTRVDPNGMPAHPRGNRR